LIELLVSSVLHLLLSGNRHGKRQFRDPVDLSSDPRRPLLQASLFDKQLLLQLQLLTS